MKAELQGAVVVTLTMAEVRDLKRAIESQATNDHGDRAKPVVELYRALVELLEGRT